MANEYVTQAELKSWLNITDNIDDALIDVCRESASRAIDGYVGRRFYKDAVASARRFRAVDPVVLAVPDFWDTATLVVETDDNNDGTFENTWTSSEYQVEPLNADAEGWPWRELVAIYDRVWPLRGPRACVRVTAKWGWAAVPADVKQALYLQGARVFKRKGAPFGIAGAGDQLGEVRMLSANLDPDVRVMLDRFRPAGQRGPSTMRIS